MFRRAGCGPWLGRACVHKDGGRARLPRIVSLLLARTRLPAMLTSRPPPLHACNGQICTCRFHGARMPRTPPAPCRTGHPRLLLRHWVRAFGAVLGPQSATQPAGQRWRTPRWLARRAHSLQEPGRGFRPRPVACSSMPPRQSRAQASLPPSRPREDSVMVLML